MSKKIEISPEYIPVSRVKVVLAMTDQGALRWMRRNNCAVKIGGRYFLTREKLLANFPHLSQGQADAEDYTR